MGFLLFLIYALVCSIVYYAMRPKKRKQTVKEETLFNKEEITEEYINFYTPFENPLADLNRPCNSAILPPKEKIISFYFTSNRTNNFSTVIEKLKKEKTFEEKNNQYHVSFPLTDFDNFIDVFEIIKKWKNSKILLGEKDVDLKMFSKMIKCIKKRQNKTNWCYPKSPDTGDYETIGCCINIPRNCFDDYLIEEENCFKIDKAKIWKEILSITNTCKFCPFYDPQIIWKNWLKIIPIINFSDTNFICLKMADDTLRAIVRINKENKPSASVAPGFKGKILSTK